MDRQADKLSSEQRMGQPEREIELTHERVKWEQMNKYMLTRASDAEDIHGEQSRNWRR